MSGTFVAFRMTNPHSSLKLNVNSPDGVDNRVVFYGGQRHSTRCEASDGAEPDRTLSNPGKT